MFFLSINIRLSTVFNEWRISIFICGFLDNRFLSISKWNRRITYLNRSNNIVFCIYCRAIQCVNWRINMFIWHFCLIRKLNKENGIIFVMNYLFYHYVEICSANPPSDVSLNLTTKSSWWCVLFGKKLNISTLPSTYVKWSDNVLCCCICMAEQHNVILAGFHLHSVFTVILIFAPTKKFHTEKTESVIFAWHQFNVVNPFKWRMYIFICFWIIGKSVLFFNAKEQENAVIFVVVYLFCHYVDICNTEHHVGLKLLQKVEDDIYSLYNDIYSLSGKKKNCAMIETINLPISKIL